MGTDGVHVEMLQSEADVWARFLTCWWGTVGRLAFFPNFWSESTLSPIFKKGDQSNPENYRPVSVLSHVRKKINATILTYVG